MKRWMSILMCVFLLGSMCLPVWAESKDAYTEEFTKLVQDAFGEDATIGPNIPLVRTIDIDDPDMNFDKMAKNTAYRIAPLYQNGEAIGAVGFTNVSGEWAYAGSMEDGSVLADALEQYGTDALYLLGQGNQLFILNQDTYPLYALRENTVEPVSAYTLSDYVLCVSYDNALPKQEGILYGSSGEIDSAYLAKAKAYWDAQSGVKWYIPVGVVICIAAAAIAGYAFYARRRRKSVKHG